MHRVASLLIAFAAVAVTPAVAAAEFRKAEHPFILWDREDLAALRRRVQAEPWAKAELERLRADKDSSAKAANELLVFAATGDTQLAEAEKAKLLRVLKSPIPRGGAQWLTVLRYDLLYERLSEAERKAFEEFARTYIRNAIFENAVFNPVIFNDSARYSRYDARRYTRANWLPNIIWPRKVSANLLAAALGDEELIRRTWAHYGSWKWYFDEYLCDDGFYSEEFSKMGSTPGEMLVYCLAVEKLGLGELGFGCRGKGGATMRGHLRSVIHLGYPRVEVGSDRPQYPMVTMGDLRQTGSSQARNLPSPAFQHSIVGGYMPDGLGGNLRWRAHGAWGGEVRGNNPQWDGYGGFTPKMQVPLWFELGASRWPEDGYAYFLARMRPPGEQVYTPSLWFGLEPIDPAKAKPPPAPSGVWPQRGILMLRADESPAYWESAAPAVAMRTATDYAHNVNDSFALLGYYAFNRPIYVNRQVWPGYASGWSRSIQSHCGVTVDGAEPKFTDATTIRHAFGPAVKFVAAASDQVYLGVTLTRGLFLTREYLLDVTRLAGTEGREYTWIVHALGRLRDEGQVWKEAALPEQIQTLKNARRLEVGNQPWAVTVDQVCALADPSQAKVPKSWYDRRIGVRLNMLGQAGTSVYAADTPLPLAEKREGDRKVTVEQASEVGGVTLLAGRRAAETTFAALHEPFEGGKGPQRTFGRIAATPQGLAVAVVGEGGAAPAVNDRLMLRLAGEPKEPLTLDGDESFTFADYAYIRIAADKVDVSCGGLSAMRLRVGRVRPRLIVNGNDTAGRFDGDCLLLGKDKP